MFWSPLNVDIVKRVYYWALGYVPRDSRICLCSDGIVDASSGNDVLQIRCKCNTLQYRTKDWPSYSYSGWREINNNIARAIDMTWNAHYKN